MSARVGPRPPRVPSASVTAATRYPIPTRRRTAPPISRRPCMPRFARRGHRLTPRARFHSPAARRNRLRPVFGRVVRRGARRRARLVRRRRRWSRYQVGGRGMRVFPPPELADPFILKTACSSSRPAAFPRRRFARSDDAAKRRHAPRVRLSAASTPSTFRPRRSPAGASNGTSVCPDDPHWILLLGQMLAPAIDVFGSFASAVLVPQRRS